MKKHVSHADLIDLFLNGEGRNHQNIRDHLAVCGSCAKNYAAIEKLFAPGTNAALDTSLQLDHKIAGAIHNQPVDSFAISGLVRAWHALGQSLTFALASAVLVVAIGLFISDGRVPSFDSIATLHYSGGRVAVNGESISKNILLTARTVIKTDASTFANIRFKDNSVLTIGNNTALEIGNNSLQGAWSSHINLQTGSIYCDFKHERYKIMYTLQTPQANIDTIGTELFLAASGNNSSLILAEGSVRVKTLAGEQTLRAASDTKYVLSNSIAMAGVTHADRLLVEVYKKYNDALAGADDGKGLSGNNRSLTKDIQDQKKEIRDKMRETKRDVRKDMRDQRKEMNSMKRHMRQERRQNGKNGNNN